MTTKQSEPAREAERPPRPRPAYERALPDLTHEVNPVPPAQPGEPGEWLAPWQVAQRLSATWEKRYGVTIGYLAVQRACKRYLLRHIDPQGDHDARPRTNELACRVIPHPRHPGSSRQEKDIWVWSPSLRTFHPPSLPATKGAPRSRSGKHASGKGGRPLTPVGPKTEASA